MKSIPAIHPAITENTENVLVKCAHQRLIIGKPITDDALSVNPKINKSVAKHLKEKEQEYYNTDARPFSTLS